MKGVYVLPKVDEEYLQEKRKEILDAAFEVCKRKPVYDVTMTDIVTETGMSQGGVYKYFKNIYSVFAALIDNANLAGDKISQIDAIMRSGAKPEDKLRELFAVSESYFSEMLISYNKILFELSTLSLQDPEIGEKIKKETKEKAVFPYLAQRAAELIITQADAGYFSPVVPVTDIIAFIVSSFDGIIRDVTMNKCYNVQAGDTTVFDEEKLISCLYMSVMKLLGM